MNKFILPAPGKLNLFLHITGRRPDGYHTLQTLFQMVELCDHLAFESTGEPGAISLRGDLAGTSETENLVYRAAGLLKQRLNVSTGVTITLNKVLPVGGGMGGGSSNAATALIGLNLLWRGGLDHTELARLGLQLGADVPLFVHGHTAWAEGVGELLTPVDVPERWFLVLMPECQVSTAEIFQHQQLTRDTSPLKIARFLEQGAYFPDQPGAMRTHNDCEKIVLSLYPAIAEAMNWLSQRSPARMTGTGASVFAVFETEKDAKQVLAKMPEDWKGVVTRGLNESPLMKAEAEIKNIIM